MKPNCSFYFQDVSRLVLTCPDLSWLVQTCSDFNYKIIISETLLVMVFNLVIEPFTTFFCFFYSIQCIPTSLYSGKHVYKLTTTCAKAKNDVYLCARSFSLRMSQKNKTNIYYKSYTLLQSSASTNFREKLISRKKKICMNDEGACVS
jgi:hypothetical protein